MECGDLGKPIRVDLGEDFGKFMPVCIRRGGAFKMAGCKEADLCSHAFLLVLEGCLICVASRQVMGEETTRRLERITAPASTSSPSSDVSARIASIEIRQNEIASTLSEFAQSLNGESLNAAWWSLVAEAQKNRAAKASAIEGLKAQTAANQKLVCQVGGVVQRIEKRTEERVEKAVEQVAGEAAATMTANLDASNERAERIIVATAKLEARQLWSAAAAMCLALLPVVLVVAGLIMGAQWALDVDGSVRLGVGRWLVVIVGLAGAGYGLFAFVRWVASLVETWRGRGMSKWPRWRKR